jgi:O-antigen ligase
MFRDGSAIRALIIYALVLPAALIMGYFMATGGSGGNAFIGLTVALLFFPLIVAYHYPMMIFSINAGMIVYFLPGSPGIGWVMAGVCLGIAIVQRTLRHKTEFLSSPSTTIPLVALIFVVIITAQVQGGFSAKSMGGETWGARRYLGIFGGAITYFAIISQHIPSHRAGFYVAMFLISALTTGMSNLIYMAGPSFYFLFNFFDLGGVYNQVNTEHNMNRLAGVAAAGMAVFYFLLLKFGLKGLFDFRRPWRAMFLIISIVMTALGGYRSFWILQILAILFHFIAEKLYKTWISFFLIGAAVCALIGISAFGRALPLSIQRSLTFLPIEFDPIVMHDASGTADWRYQMWKTLWPDVPKYMWLGKGYSFSSTDFQLTKMAVERGYYQAWEDALITGSYHHGFLTLWMSFGLWGTLAFMAFVGMGAKIMWWNFKNGPSELKMVNCFLLCTFLARLLTFSVVYGQFELDFVFFASYVGLAVAINKRPISKSTAPVFQKQPAEPIEPAAGVLKPSQA